MGTRRSHTLGRASCDCSVTQGEFFKQNGSVTERRRALLFVLTSRWARIRLPPSFLFEAVPLNGTG
jgi:hypothetical protein